MVNAIKVLLLGAWLCGVTKANIQKKLMEDLLKGYKKTMRPVENYTSPTIVTIQLSLHHLRQLNEKFQVLTVNAWLEMNWADTFLKWNKSNYEGVTILHLPSSMIWRPDIVLSNSVDQERTSIELLSDTMVTIDNDGEVSWSSPALFKSTCRLNVKDYPFDVQKCPLAFGSWSHHSGELILRPQTTIVHTNEYKRNENGEWNVLGVKGHVYSRRFACCKEIFTYAIYFVVMKRRPLFYLFHLAFPISLFMVIGVFVFIVPPESGEKVDLAMSVLLSMSFFMLVLMDNIPPSSETISLFAYFIGGVTALLSVATYLSVMITFVYFQGVQGRRPPKWFKFIVLSCLAKLLGIGEYSFLTGLWRIVKRMERKPEEGETTYSVSTFDTGCPTSGSLDERSSSQLNLECVGYNSDFAGTNGNVVGNKGNVAGNNANVAGNNANVAGHNGNVDGNNANVAGNNANVAGNNGNVAGNNGNVAVNNGNVAGHNGNVAGNNDNVAGNNGNVAGNFNSRNITHNNNIGSMSIPTPNLLLADMVDVLIDILEEMRMMRANTSKVRLTETSVGLVTAEWHDIAMVLDRACFVGYSIANIVFAVAIAKRIPPEVHLEDVALPAKM